MSEAAIVEHMRKSTRFSDMATTVRRNIRQTSNGLSCLCERVAGLSTFRNCQPKVRLCSIYPGHRSQQAICTQKIATNCKRQSNTKPLKQQQQHAFFGYSYLHNNNKHTHVTAKQ